MAVESKIYNWDYTNNHEGVEGVSSEGRPQIINNGSHIIDSSLLTEVNEIQKISGKIDNITLSLIMRRVGSSTVSVDVGFSLSDGTTSYSSNTVTCSGITETNETPHIIDMPTANCPPVNFFNSNFTLTVSYSNASRTGIYCPENHNFILTVNYTKGCQIYVKVNGVWKEATPYVKVGGVWKEASPSTKINGTWKQ